MKKFFNMKKILKKEKMEKNMKKNFINEKSGKKLKKNEKIF